MNKKTVQSYEMYPLLAQKGNYSDFTIFYETKNKRVLDI